MKNIIIVGGDSFARECCWHLSRIIDAGADSVKIGGYLSHNGNVCEAEPLRGMYLGDFSQYSFKENDYAVIGVANIPIRKKIYFDLKEKNAKFYNIITPECKISASAKIGECNVLSRSSLSVDIEIGDCNVFNGEVLVGHDCKIGSFNFFAPRSNILGKAAIGDENSIGTGSVLLPSCKIGSRNKIAPLSAVYRGCKDDCYMRGNPAAKI